MKVVILAGGFGTRLTEETSMRPKPMIDIGGQPLLLHIMKLYSAYGFHDFIVCLGYMGYYIKEYFSNYALHRSDVTYDFGTGQAEYFNKVTENWRVTLVDTGLTTMTGGRLKRVREILGQETFMMTYGDGLADINLQTLLAFHKRHGRSATVTAVQPPGRFGVLEMAGGDMVTEFREKPEDEIGWINGGYFVLEPAVIDLIDGDETIWERAPMVELTHSKQLMAYRHRGFWQPVDTLRDKQTLEAIWNAGNAPWQKRP
jgi:glucose-1-phosphate cytidylyltransferase